MTTRNILLKHIELLGRCMCEQCQREKKKCEERLDKDKPVTYQRYGNLSEQKLPPEHDKKCIEYWQLRATEYESMFLEQKDICAGYRKIVKEQEEIIKKLKLKK